MDDIEDVKLHVLRVCKFFGLSSTALRASYPIYRASTGN